MHGGFVRHWRLFILFRGKADQLLRHDLGSLHVQRHIEPHRALAPVEHQVQRLLQLIAHAQRIEQAHRILGQWRDHTDDIQLLGAELTQAAISLEVGTLDLSGNEQRRCRLEPGTSQAGNGIGRAGAGSDQAGTEFTAGTRIAFGGDRGALLVEHAHGSQPWLTQQGVVEVHGPATRQEEHMPDALVSNELKDVVGNAHRVAYSAIGCCGRRAAGTAYRTRSQPSARCGQRVKW